MFSLISSDINEKSLYDFDTKEFKFRKLAPIPENQVVFRNNCLLHRLLFMIIILVRD